MHFSIPKPGEDDDVDTDTALGAADIAQVLSLPLPPPILRLHLADFTERIQFFEVVHTNQGDRVMLKTVAAKLAGPASVAVREYKIAMVTEGSFVQIEPMSARTVLLDLSQWATLDGFSPRSILNEAKVSKPTPEGKRYCPVGKLLFDVFVLLSLAWVLFYTLFR